MMARAQPPRCLIQAARRTALAGDTVLSRAPLQQEEWRLLPPDLCHGVRCGPLLSRPHERLHVGVGPDGGHRAGEADEASHRASRHPGLAQVVLVQTQQRRSVGSCGVPDHAMHADMTRLGMHSDPAYEALADSVV